MLPVSIYSLRSFTAGADEAGESIDHVQTPFGRIPHVDGDLSSLQRAELVKVRHWR